MTDKEQGDIPDPNEFEEEESEISPSLERRADLARTLAQNGYSGTLVVSRDRIHDLADETRLTILDELQDGPLTNAELAQRLGLKESVVGEHIAKLNTLGITVAEDDDRFRLANKRVIIEPLHWPESKVEAVLNRQCVECGKTIQITVFEGGLYEGGHYFGEISTPDEDSEGEYKKTGEWDGFDVVEWTGEKESFEYWECEACFSAVGDQHD